MAKTSKPATSAGLLLYRRAPQLEVLVVHPGGPFFANKDDGSWSLPKGLLDEGETPLDAAKREFREETGFAVPDGPMLDLGEVRLKSGKRVLAWAVEGDCDPGEVHSNTFEMQWPPRSGLTQAFPEVDRAGFFSPEDARVKLNPRQAPFVERLEELLRGG